MAKETKIKLFQNQEVRLKWDEEIEEYYFSVIDVVGILSESKNPRKYWSVLKTRLKKEGNEMATNCSQLKLPASDGKSYLTDVADTEQVFRIAQTTVIFDCLLNAQLRILQLVHSLLSQRRKP